MKRCIGLILVVVFLGVHSASAFTDPVSKSKVRHTDDDVVAYEYYHPSKSTIERSRKPQRAIAIIADSILAVAKENFNHSTTSAAQSEASVKESVVINVETDLSNYRYKADAITLRTRNWADSICNLFRRPSFTSDPEFLPR